jgi:hypothetical protein
MNSNLSPTAVGVERRAMLGLHKISKAFQSGTKPQKRKGPGEPGLIHSKMM